MKTLVSKRINGSQKHESIEIYFVSLFSVEFDDNMTIINYFVGDIIVDLLFERNKIDFEKDFNYLFRLIFFSKHVRNML